MSLPSSGSLSMTQIKNEYTGDTSPHQLSEFYRNGAYVKNWAAAQSVPTGGTIAYSNFRGTAASSNLNDAQIQDYIWANRDKLHRVNNCGGTGTTVGGQAISMLWIGSPTANANNEKRTGEPNGNTSLVRNARGRTNGVADFTDAQSLVYLGPTTTFLFVSSSYNYGVPYPTITAFDKNNNQVTLNEIHRQTADGNRGEVRLLRCTSTDYNSFGYVVAAGGSGDLSRPGFASIMMLPGQWDLWGSQVVTASNPTTTPTYYTITNPPRGLTILQGGAYLGNGGSTTFMNTTTPNPSGNWNPVESASKRYIKTSYYFDYHIETAWIGGTDAYDSTTWKHRIGTTYYNPLNPGANPATFRITQLYRTGN